MERNLTYENPLFFAIGAEFFTASQLLDLFVMDVNIVETSRGQAVSSSSVELFVCTIEHLKSVFDDAEAERLFTSYGLEDKFCPNSGSMIRLKGKYNTNAQSLIGLKM